MDLYLIDVGILLQKENAEFESYAIVYDKKYGYYDENQYFKRDIESAIADAKEYVQKGKEGTYAIISLQTGFQSGLSDEQISDLDVFYSKYEVGNVVYSLRKENGQLIENFIQV